MRGVHREVRPLRLNGPVRHAFVVGRVLQFAVAATDLAEWAEVITLTEQHGQHEMPRLLQRGRVGAHHHAVAGGQRARRLDRAEAFDLDYTEAAAAIGLDRRMMAQLGNANVELFRGFQNRGAFRHFDGLVIDCEFDHRHTLVNEFVRGHGLYG